MLFASCKQEATTEPIDTEKIPIQVVNNMEFVQSDKGSIKMRMKSTRMEHYEFVKDSVEQSYDLYCDGFHVELYTADGALETEVNSQQAKHVTTPGQEAWSAFGEVVITNHIKQETVTSDTVYWDQAIKRIHTDCYVKITSPGGVMQGYGMESDDRAREAILLKPFDSYSVLRDSTSTDIIEDTLNFIGPMPKPFKTK